MEHAAKTAPGRVTATERSVLRRHHTILVLALGLSLSSFLAISSTLCVLGYLLFPSLPVAHGLLSLVLPGFVLLSGPSFFLGLVESAAWGWYIALIFGPLYNYFATRTQAGPAER